MASTDEELLARWRRGDARSMDELVDRHGASVYAFVRRLAGGDAPVDDLVQDAWLRVLRGAAGFDGRSRFTTWLFAVVRSACIDALRRRRRAQGRGLEAAGAGGGDDRPPQDPVDPGPPVLDEVERRELEGLVEQAVADLTPTQREVFLLREGTDLSFTEISTALGLPRETVKSRMRYALTHVRRFLRDRLGVDVALPGKESEDGRRGL